MVGQFFAYVTGLCCPPDPTTNSETTNPLFSCIHKVSNFNFGKVGTFWEIHKIWKNLPHALDVYKVNVQSMRKIAQIFVCFSESPNFTIPPLIFHAKTWVTKYLDTKGALISKTGCQITPLSTIHLREDAHQGRDLAPFFLEIWGKGKTFWDKATFTSERISIHFVLQRLTRRL